MAPRRWGAFAVLLSILLLPLLSTPSKAQEMGLFELRLTAIPETRTVTVLVDERGTVLIPLRPALEFLRIPVREAGDTLELDWPPEVWRTEVIRSERRVRIDTADFVVPAADWQEVEGESYLAPAALGRLLAGEVTVDWENLGILFGGNAGYPVVVHTHNAARRQAGARARERRRPPAEPAVPYPSRSGGVAFAWDLAASATGDQPEVRARLATGVAVMGGALESGASVGYAHDDFVLTSPFMRYDRGFPQSAWLRRLQVGHVFTEGFTARPVLGLTVTNEPLYAPTYFGEALLQPLVPAGWEFEVYQGDDLIGVSTAGTTEPVPTPLSYGATPVRVRLIGPAGEERVQEIVFLVPAVQVPPGDWRYAAGGGACQGDECDGYGYADLRHGISTRLTLGGGLEGATHGDTTVLLPYGILAWNPAPALRGELRLQPGRLLYGSLHRYDRRGGWRLVAGTRPERGLVSPGTNRWFVEGGGGMAGFLPGRGRILMVNGRVEGDSAGRAAMWRGSVTSGFGRAQLTATWEQGLQRESVLSLQSHVLVPRYILPRARDLNVTTRVDVTESGLRSVLAGFSARPYDRANVTVLAGWNRDTRAPEISVGLLTRLPGAYVQSNVFAQGARRGAFLSAGGGAAVGGDRVVLDPFQMLGRAGVTGRVFLDENGNGVYDAGEPTVRGAPVALGGDRAFTDSAGRYSAWGVFPYAVLEAGIDTLNLTQTDLAASTGVQRIRPTPNMFSEVDLPLVRTREVTGRIRWRGTPGPLGGITVELRREGEAAPRRVVTFSDGEYYLPQMRPGRYTISVAESSLAALRARLDPGPVVFDLSAEGPVSMEAPTLWVTRT